MIDVVDYFEIGYFEAGCFVFGSGSVDLGFVDFAVEVGAFLVVDIAGYHMEVVLYFVVGVG